MTDLYDLMSDDDRACAETAGDGQQLLHEAVDAERPVDLDWDDYREAA